MSLPSWQTTPQKLQAELEKQGVLFMDMDSGLREHPEIVKKFFGTVLGLKQTAAYEDKWCEFDAPDGKSIALVLSDAPPEPPKAGPMLWTQLFSSERSAMRQPSAVRTKRSKSVMETNRAIWVRACNTPLRR